MRVPAPLLWFSLLVAAYGMNEGQQKVMSLEEFVEEVRGALAGQWELLQNLRYHALGIKVRLAKLETQVHSLASHLHAQGGHDADTPSRRDEGRCGGGTAEGEEGGGGDVLELVEAMKNLTQAYTTLASSLDLPPQMVDFEDDIARLAGMSGSGGTLHQTHTTATAAATTTPAASGPAEKDDEEEDEQGEEEEEEEDVEEEEEEEEEPQPSIVLSHSKNVTASAGSTAVLTCRFDHLRDPGHVAWVRKHDLHWLSLGRHVVTASERILAAFSDKELRDYQLFIKDARIEDQGPYECQLSTNSAVTHTIWLTVTDPLASPPRVEQRPQDTVAVEGKDVTLTCRISGHPQPAVTWTRNDLLVSSSARYQVTLTGDLVIRGVRRGDAGRFVCTAANPSGRAEAEALLTVQPPARILRPPRDRQRQAGETVVLRCRAAGGGERAGPVQVDWFKDGAIIDFARSPARVSRRPNNALVVSAAQPEDSGVYTCRASTPYDTASASATLTILKATTSSSPSFGITLPADLDYCPPPFERIQRHVCVLEVTHKKLSWEDAAKHCREQGGQLAWESEESPVLQVFLEERYGLGGTSGWTMWPFWVGGREGAGREWVWLDGSPVAAGVWAPEHRRDVRLQQGATGGRCLMLDGYQDYRAAALPCQSKRYFLCRLK